jgi:uncharacterized protein (TIGR00375 family)
MRIIADLHIHSPYSRAVSRDMTLENLDRWARIKGITVIGTGDFTHPVWIREIREKLEPAEQGLYRLKNRDPGGEAVKFLLSVEISSIYTANGRTRRIHNLVFVPSISAAEKINVELGWRGNLKSDGRPILGLDAKDLAKIVFDAEPDAMVVPAHCWTPWFSIFGSMSGFDSIDECFGEYAKYIYAVETGLSSDPAMNWRWSHLDKVALISNSDSHSLPRIGREANVFDTELSYKAMTDAIKSRDPRRFLSTIEFFPEEGKYHYDGHRVCLVRFNPEETKRRGGQCPKCGKPVTVGVMNRVEALADRPVGFRPPSAIPYKNMIPLDEIIAESFGVGVSAKSVKEEYRVLTERLGGEYAVLMDASRSDLESATVPEVVEGIMRVRDGRLAIEPGYDGEYGTIKIFQEGEKNRISPQSSLF